MSVCGMRAPEPSLRFMFIMYFWRYSKRAAAQLYGLLVRAGVASMLAYSAPLSTTARKPFCPAPCTTPYMGMKAWFSSLMYPYPP